MVYCWQNQSETCFSISGTNSSAVERNDVNRQQNERFTQSDTNRRSSNGWVAPTLLPSSDNALRRSNIITPAQESFNNSTGNRNSSNSDIVCHCNNEAMLLTCQNGQNKGKPIFPSGSKLYVIFI